MYYPRTAEKELKELGKYFPCITIYGPRQVGKSTLVRHTFGERFITVSLDDFENLTLALNNPKLFLDSNPCPVIIDEIQRAPILLMEIKRRIDLEREKWLDKDEPNQLLYVLTGSNQYELQHGVSESLAGRTAVFHFNSFSLAEKRQIAGELFNPDIAALQQKERRLMLNPLNRNDVFKEIFQGGMPSIVAGGMPRDMFFKSYVDTYIEKDVRKLISTDSLILFRSFLSFVALRTGQEVHYDEIANSVGIDVKTVKKWLSILECSGIIVFLQPYMANISNRIIKAPKLYFMDTGLASYLCGWQDENMLEKGVMAGAFYETFIVSEMIKNLSFRGKEWNGTLYYYRDTNQKEVDLLFVSGQAIYPIEIKKGILPSKPTKNFSVLTKYGLPIKTGLVIDSCDAIRPINEAAYSIPVALIE